jgi:hypothetical protein
MADYILMRISKSPTIQANITPTVVKMDASPPETRFTQFMVQVSESKLLPIFHD